METVELGAPVICPTCGVRLVMEVLKSAAGYYIGFFCYSMPKGNEEFCYGPYSRESGYYRSSEEAEKAMNTGNFGRL
jgi:hypothetical protein